MYKYPHISQFRNVVEEVSLRATFIGKDPEGAPMYDEHLPKPTINFVGTVKLDGTNAGVVLSDGKLTVQSRNSIITPESDNFGFAAFVQKAQEPLEALLHEVELRCPISSKAVILYGEWAGQGINSGRAIHQLPRALYLFAACGITEGDEPVWLSCLGLNAPEAGVYNVFDFRQFSIDIDFNSPEDSAPGLEEATQEVGQHCPVSAALGVDGPGEGIVWVSHDNRFKTKVLCDTHAAKKVAVAPDVLETAQAFADATVTDDRVNQAIFELFGEATPCVERLGDYLKWMHQDILREEADVLATSGLGWKDAVRCVTHKAKAMFLEALGR